ncbi:hypothetical protein [Blastococcus mobilis]|uniref:Uncharacterized protein n=1 Tax=Blastococcus mobilis TaxID=1938746 RepID=A0A238UUF3_9ACTN|nr:hypothetical protein [Blastococcus mobilis]SNR25357.1 hypothetical protein SAMN06272737_101348 [Blastococcus mobilis]
MFLLVFAVPALLVVVLGYVVGYGLWSWIGGCLDAVLGTSLAGGAEIAGWVTGLVLLLGVVRAAIRRSRARRP